MKILFVNYSIGGYASDAVQMITVVKGLKKRGHDITIATTDGDGYFYDKKRSALYAPIRKKLINGQEKIIEIDGMSIYPIHCNSSKFGMYCFSASKEAKKIIREFDLIYIINWYYHLGMVFSKIAHEYKVPFIVGPMASLQAQAHNMKNKQKWILDKMYTNKMLKNADGFHCVGHQEKESLLKLGVKPEKINIIDNGIVLKNYDTKKTTQILEKNKIKLNGNPYLLNIGRIDPKKGIDLMLLVFSQLNKKYKNLRLVIVGTGPENYVKEMKELTKKLGINESVKFTGYVTEEEKIELLNSAKLFVVTSHSDVHTTTAIEAMAVGIPVVITKASDFPEIDSYEAGFTVESTQKSIYDAIEELLEDEEKLKRFSKNAKKLVNDRFLLENQIEKYEKMFMEISKGNNQSD
jgi:glycosyltransferase involved in cell wall biosynthesis